MRELGVALGLRMKWSTATLPRAGPGRAHPRRGQSRIRQPAATRRRDFIEELRNTIDEASGKSWYDLTSQAFAVFLPVKSVGVMGDGRTYEWVVALRAGGHQRLHDRPLGRTALQPVGPDFQPDYHEVRGINRVVYDVSGKPPATIEWE